MVEKLKFEKTIFITLAFCVLCVVVGLIYSSIIKNSYIHSEIENFKTVDDIKSADIKIEYAHDKKFNEDIFSILKDAPLILIVKPTGNVLQARASFNQEVEIISNINSGDNNFKKGDIINVFIGNYCFNYVNSQMVFQSANNILMPENSYLLFLEEDELNEYRANKKCRLYGQTTDFSAINLDRTDKQEVCVDYNFNNLTTTDNFVVSQKILTNTIKIEDEILNKYSEFVANEIIK